LRITVPDFFGACCAIVPRSKAACAAPVSTTDGSNRNEDRAIGLDGLRLSSGNIPRRPPRAKRAANKKAVGAFSPH